MDILCLYIMRYKFVKQSADMLYNPPREQHSYYQICSFKNDNGLYEIRKYILNEHGEIVNSYDKEYNKKKLLIVL